MKKETSKKLFNIALASAMATGAVVAVAPAATDAATPTLKDLKQGSWYYDSVLNLVERGVIAGYPDETFKPGQDLTRGHAALILARLLELDTENVTDPKFTDVPKTHPSYGAIAALENAGIINGISIDKYGVNDPLTRGQMAILIAKVFELEAGSATTPFKDIEGYPYKEQITALYANGVTTGMTPTTFDYRSNVTRGQFATFVVRAEEVTAVEKVVDIKDGQIITNKGTYAIEGDLAKVFNASNAAALKDAEINFNFAEQTAAVASLEFVAAEATTKKIVGIASLTLVAGNATFDAGGYSIPVVAVNGNNIEVKNVIVEKLNIADNLQVNLTGVEAKEIIVSETTKLTLDATSKIEKLTLPKGTDITDIITNYEEVKDAIKEVVEVTEGGNETPVDPEEPEKPSTGGGGSGGSSGGGSGGGGGGTPTPSIDSAIDAAIKNLITTENNDKISDFGEITFSASSNTINFTIKDGSGSKTISDVRAALKTNSEGVNYSDLVDGLSDEEIDELLKVTTATVTADKHSYEFKRSKYFDFSKLDIKREALIEDVDKFIDEAIRKSGETVVNLDQFGQVFDGEISINVEGIKYTVNIDGYTPAK